MKFKKENLYLIFKILVSVLFLFLVFRKIDFASLKKVLLLASPFWLTLSFVASMLTTWLLAFRWSLIIQSQGLNLPYGLLLKLTFVGIFFNLFLPTGAGGDLVKIIYVTRGEKEKIALGGSVVMDRLIGSISIITMGFLAINLKPSLANRPTFFVMGGLFVFLLGIILFLSSVHLGVFTRTLLQKLLPQKILSKLINLYRSFALFSRSHKYFFSSLATSFLLQIITLISQYMIVLSFAGGLHTKISLWPFFIYIPLIWTAMIIPSLGGLGVREFSYKVFFGKILGLEATLALALIVLFFIIVQSLVGGLIFSLDRKFLQAKR